MARRAEVDRPLTRAELEELIERFKSRPEAESKALTTRPIIVFANSGHVEDQMQCRAIELDRASLDHATKRTKVERNREAGASLKIHENDHFDQG